MTRNERIAVAAVCIALLFAVAGLSFFSTRATPAKAQTETAHPSTKSDLPAIKIGVDIKEPFVYIGSDGDYTGIDVDIAREACRRAGLDPQFVRIDWNERDNLLAKGEIDCLWCGYSWNSRADRYRWTHTYLTTTISALIKKGDPAQSLSELDNTRSVSVRAGSVSERKLLTGALGTPEDIPVRAYGSVDLSVAAFVKGYTSCWMGYTYLADRIMAQYPGMFRVLEADVLTIDLGVAFDQSYNGPYIDKLDDAIDAMKEDGTSRKIEKRYITSLMDKGKVDDGS